MDDEEILDKHIDSNDALMSEINQMRGALHVILTDTKKIITNPVMEQVVKDERIEEQINRALALITRGEGWR